MQSLESNFILSRHGLQGFIQSELSMAEIYGDLDMSESSILGTCCHVSIDDADVDEDIIDMLRECMRERMLHITYIIDEMIYAAVMHAKIDKKINWI